MSGRWISRGALLAASWALAGGAVPTRSTSPPSWVAPINGSCMTDWFHHRDAPVGGATSTHRAIDARAPCGTPVVAVAPGRVVRVGRNMAKGYSGYGYVIWIDHGNGHVSRYNHLTEDSAKVAEGATVRAGQTIGLSGASGLNGMACHLDFQVFRDGAPIDPEPLVKMKFCDRKGPTRVATSDLKMGHDPAAVAARIAELNRAYGPRGLCASLYGDWVELKRAAGRTDCGSNAPLNASTTPVRSMVVHRPSEGAGISRGGD